MFSLRSRWRDGGVHICIRRYPRTVSVGVVGGNLERKPDWSTAAWRLFRGDWDCPWRKRQRQKAPVSDLSLSS